MKAEPRSKLVPKGEQLQNLRLDVGPRHTSLVEPQGHAVPVGLGRHVRRRDYEIVEKAVADRHGHAAGAKVPDDVVEYVGANGVGNDVCDIGVLPHALDKPVVLVRRLVNRGTPKATVTSRCPREVPIIAKNRLGQSPKRVSGPERRRRILQSVSPLFAERGYEGTHTAALASAADVSEALLYQHWRTKADLYRAVLDWTAEVVEGRLLKAALADIDTEQRLRQLADAWLETSADPTVPWTIFTFTVGEQSIAQYQRSIRDQAAQALALLLVKDRPNTTSQVAVAEALIGAAAALGLRARRDPNADRGALVAVLADFARAAGDHRVHTE